MHDRHRRCWSPRLRLPFPPSVALNVIFYRFREVRCSVPGSGGCGVVSSRLAVNRLGFVLWETDARPALGLLIITRLRLESPRWLSSAFLMLICRTEMTT